MVWGRGRAIAAARAPGCVAVGYCSCTSECTSYYVTESLVLDICVLLPLNISGQRPCNPEHHKAPEDTDRAVRERNRILREEIDSIKARFVMIDRYYIIRRDARGLEQEDRRCDVGLVGETGTEGGKDS